MSLNFRQATSKCINQFGRFYHKIGVIGVPFNKGQPISGVELGPAALRSSGFLQDLKTILPDIDIKDYGDISYEVHQEINVPNLKNWSHVAECNKQLSGQVFNIIREERISLMLGGDHSLALGSIDGHARANPNVSVLWIDAHADMNTNNSSATGNCHGMPLAFLAKELEDQWSKLPGLKWQKPMLSLNNLAYIGLRDVDRFEREIIEEYGVAAFDMKDVQRLGIRNVIQIALNRIDPESNRPIHVSFDIDSLDVLEAPSTGTPVRGGLTLREGIEIMETVCETGRMQAMDLVEVNPMIGTARDVEITLGAAKEIIVAAFGNNRKGIAG